MGLEGRHLVPRPRFQSSSLPSSVSPEFFSRKGKKGLWELGSWGADQFPRLFPLNRPAHGSVGTSVRCNRAGRDFGRSRKFRLDRLEKGTRRKEKQIEIKKKPCSDMRRGPSSTAGGGPVPETQGQSKPRLPLPKMAWADGAGSRPRWLAPGKAALQPLPETASWTFLLPPPEGARQGTGKPKWLETWGAARGVRVCWEREPD